MHPVNSVFYKGAGLNPIREDFVQAEWPRARKVNSRRSLKNEIDYIVCIVGIIMVQVRMGYSRVKVVFGIVWDLAVPVVLRTLFTDRIAKNIFSREQRIVLYNS